jgi:alginate O-acetyltransferase complex protein AlgI
LQILYSFLVVTFGWVLFRADDFSRAAGYLRAMFGFGRGDGREFYTALFLNREVLFIMAFSLLVAAPVAPALQAIFARIGRGMSEKHRSWLNGGYRFLTGLLLIAVLLASSMRLAMATYNPFIYFRF